MISSRGTFVIFSRHNSPDWGSWDGGKHGGKPSWLNPRDIPKEPLRCKLCSERNGGNGTLLRFLCQIYSPADAETGNSDAFHRSLYVFCCPNETCSTADNMHESVVVLRGQLPKNNDFYPDDCDNDDVVQSWKKHNLSAWKINACICCGQRATGRCPSTQTYFCSKEHQKLYHKLMKKSENVDEKILAYDESELVVEEEPEEIHCQEDREIEQEQIADDMNKMSLFGDNDGDNDDALLEQSDLNEMTGLDGGTSDPITMEFYNRISISGGDVKSQCLRYSRWPEYKIEGDDDFEENIGPLWISTDGRPTVEADIPNCKYCNSKREYEFQLMPQMLNFLMKTKGKESNSEITKEGKTALLTVSDFIDKTKEVGSESDLPPDLVKKQEELVDQFKSKVLQENDDDETLDFGTIGVFTCTASCSKKNTEDIFGAYHQEFAWRQKPLGL
jgi:pre-rRNA-processing protein TSR4